MSEGLPSPRRPRFVDVVSSSEPEPAAPSWQLAPESLQAFRNTEFDVELPELIPVESAEPPHRPSTGRARAHPSGFSQSPTPPRRGNPSRSQPSICVDSAVTSLPPLPDTPGTPPTLGDVVFADTLPASATGSARADSPRRNRLERDFGMARSPASRVAVVSSMMGALLLGTLFLNLWERADASNGARATMAAGSQLDLRENAFTRDRVRILRLEDRAIGRGDRSAQEYLQRMALRLEPTDQRYVAIQASLIRIQQAYELQRQDPAEAVGSGNLQSGLSMPGTPLAVQ